MKNKKIVAFLMICLAAVLLTGCKKDKEAESVVDIEVEEVNMFGLTDREQKMYAEYAAGVLMKYNAGSNMRVLEGQKLINETAKEEEKRLQEEKRQQAAAEYAEKKENPEDEQEIGDVASDSSNKPIKNHISDMSEAIESSSFSIQYTGYEVTDAYPNSGEDILLTVDASQGQVLLVTKFMVMNISSETEEFDMFSQQPVFKLNLNGSNYKSQYTLLLEDLSMYKGEVEANSVAETLLVFEVPETEVSNMNDMQLSITVGNKTSIMLLEGGSGVVTISDSGEEVFSDDMGSEEEIESDAEETFENTEFEDNDNIDNSDSIIEGEDNID